MLSKSVETLAELFLERAALSANVEAYRRKVEGRWERTTWAEFAGAVKALAAALSELGVGRGDAVAIRGNTCPEWCQLDLATLLLGAVSVGIYPTLPEDQVSFILEDCRAKVFFSQDSSGRFATEDGRTLDALLARGRELPGVEARVEPGDRAIVVYTSGTTGRPKGVPLTHRNVLAMLRAAEEVHDPITSEDTTLSFLPMAHVGEHVVGFFGRISTGLRTSFATSYDTVLDELKEVRPTYFGGVPRIFEKMYGRIFERVARASPRRRAIFRRAEALARRKARADMGGEPLRLVDRLLLPVFDAFVYRRMRAVFGGRVKAFVSGSAPLSVEILEFFHGAGMKIVEVYGLSETCGIVFGNTLEDCRLGTVGKPLPGLEWKIAEDGEILVRGPMVFSGYLNVDEDVFDADGYLKTGDVGSVDADGYLKITDRKKNLLKTAGGKFVAPARLEALVKQGEPLVSQVYVHGDERPYVTALITLDARETGRVAAELGVAESALPSHPEVLRRVAAAVAGANARLARFEQIKRHAVLPRDFSIEDGTLTPTLKIKRRAVAARYASELETLYAGEAVQNRP